MQTADYANILDKISQTQNQLVKVGDETLIVPIRVPTNGEYVVIDAVNFVCNISSFDSFEMLSLETSSSDLLNMGLDLNQEQYEYIINLALDNLKIHLGEIFGEDFANLMATGRGIHYYKHGYTASSKEGDLLLNVGIGGQKNTVFIGVTGTGCKLAADGWENRLHHFLEKIAINGRITRIDLAHDDLDGSYSSFEMANQKESEQAFMLPKARNRPAVRIDGEFKHGDPQDKGLTLYVGSRPNGKIIRCYEKGKQLGDKSSAWFRSEVEFHNKKRLIPFDVLLHPTEYFCGAYPYTLELVELAKKHGGDNTPQHLQAMPSVKNESKISLFRMIEIFKTQFGKHLKTMGELFVKDDKPDYNKIFEILKTDKKDDYYPKRLRLPVAFFSRKDKLQAINEFEKEFLEKSYNNFLTQRQHQQKLDDMAKQAKTIDYVMDYFYNILKSPTNNLNLNPMF